MIHVAKILRAVSVLAVMVSLALVPQTAEATCLNYWTVGMSGCDGKKPEKKEQPKIVAEVPEETSPSKPEEKGKKQPQKKQKPEMEERVDEFLKNYEKPPREFAKFHLEPNLENALAWVQKYNDIIARSRQLAAMWTQAQQIYQERTDQGQEAVPGYKSDLPPVPDLGVPLPGGMRQVFQQNQPGQQGPGGPMANLNRNSNITMPGQTPGSLDDLRRKSDSIGGSPDDAIEIRYYFSAQCPFCERFEPGLQSVVQEMGNKVQVTCVDMTPGGQEESNIHGKVDCDWRPLMPGEKDAYNVEATPTLLVNRNNGGPMERISGYIDEKTLRNYIKNGPKGG